MAARRRLPCELAADLGQANREVVLSAAQQEAGAHAGPAGTGLVAGKGRRGHVVSGARRVHKCFGRELTDRIETPRAIAAGAGAVRGAVAAIADNGDHLMVVACRTNLQRPCVRRRQRLAQGPAPGTGGGVVAVVARGVAHVNPELANAAATSGWPVAGSSSEMTGPTTCHQLLSIGSAYAR